MFICWWKFVQEQGLGYQWCGISIKHEDCVCIASLNKQPNNSLHSAPLCFLTYRSGYCARLFLQDQGLGDCSLKKYLYIASLNNQPLTHLHISVSQQSALWFVPDENLREPRVLEIARGKICPLTPMKTAQGAVYQSHARIWSIL